MPLALDQVGSFVKNTRSAQYLEVARRCCELILVSSYKKEAVSASGPEPRCCDSYRRGCTQDKDALHVEGCGSDGCGQVTRRQKLDEKRGSM